LFLILRSRSLISAGFLKNREGGELAGFPINLLDQKDFTAFKNGDIFRASQNMLEEKAII